MRSNLILLVEDNPDDVLLTQRALIKGNIIHELVVVNDGVEALEYLFGEGKYAGQDRSTMPEVILLDLKMPKMNGLEVLQRIRGDGRTNLLPVVILTSSKEEQDIVSSYKLGANSYICKPVDYDQFLNVIQQLGLYWLVYNESSPIGGKNLE
jgi:two-component system response regulator